jgi:pilus assembly protein CpaB
MTLRTILLLVFALSAAALAALFANNWLASNRNTAARVDTPEPPKALVLVAKQEVATGTFIKPELLTWQQWPEDGIRDGYLVKGKSTEKDLEGAVVRTRLYAGEPITRDRVVQPGEQGFLAAVLEPGKRAVAVPVDATRGVGGFVFPGDLVDVILTIKTTVDITVEANQGERKEKETRYFGETLLTNVRVLGIDQTVDNTDGMAKVAKTATLEVTPKQAEKVAIALDLGFLSLSLHSLARDEADIDGLVSKAGKTAATSYTRDTDVLSMIGDPLGLPAPHGTGPQVILLRGAAANTVRF